MKYIYFQNVDSVEELKKQYKTLAFKYHLDREGGSVSAMQRINAEYDELLKTVRNVHKTADGKTYTKKEESRADVPDRFKEIINAIMKYNCAYVSITSHTFTTFSLSSYVKPYCP